MRPVNWSSPINWSHPLNKDLLSWHLVVPHWTGGTVWRDLTARLDGTLTAMAPASDWVGPGSRPGGWGALDFDGTDDYVDLGASALYDLDADPLTCLAWINVRTWFSFARIVDSSHGWTLALTNTEGGINAGTSTGGHARQDSAGVSLDTWHLLAMTSTGAVPPICYVNGLDVSASGGGNTFSTTNTNIGLRNLATDDRIFNGFIDDVRIYNRVLSPADIAEYHQLSKQFYPGLLNRRGRRVVVAAAAGNAMPMAMDHYRRRRVA